MISRLQYLTQDISYFSHVEMAEEFCRYTDIDWLQLRMKDVDANEMLSIGNVVRDICTLLDVTLIVNDHIEIAEKINADGVHLGQNDMSIEDARAILGEEKIIGGTANTFEELALLNDAGADYAGVGPYRFTRTKKELSEVIGIHGYAEIIKRCKEDNVKIPIIAIGGIKIKDVPVLMHAGVHGIAVSSAINLSKHKTETVKEFTNAIDSAMAVRN